MERLEAFEKMLDDLKAQAAYEENQMEQLKAAVERSLQLAGSFSATGSFINRCWTPIRNMA